MRIITETKEVYTYEELSDAAKERVRDWYIATIDYDWWEGSFDYIRDCALALGIDVDRGNYGIRFSGFYSQGDGASFVGGYRYRKGWKAALKAAAGGDTLTELTTIGADLQAAQKPYFYGLVARVAPNRGCRYSHERSVYIDVEDRDGRDVNADDTLAEPLRDFMHWMYKLLEREYEWLCSEEQVADACAANGYEFDVNGNTN